SALATAVRNANGGAFPCHPRGERADLVKRNLRMIAYSAFGRPAGDVVLHAVALEDPYRAVIHFDRDRDDELPLGIRQNRAKAFVEPDQIGSQVELFLSDVKRVEVLGGLNTCSHVSPPGRAQGRSRALAGTLTYQGPPAPVNLQKRQKVG